MAWSTEDSFWAMSMAQQWRNFAMNAIEIEEPCWRKQADIKSAKAFLAKARGVRPLAKIVEVEGNKKAGRL